MRRTATLAAPLLLLLVAPPLASASCVYSERGDLSEVLAVTRERALTHRGEEWGWTDLRGENFTPIGVATAARSPVAASPDGAWIAWERLEGPRGWNCAAEGAALAMRATDADPSLPAPVTVDGAVRALAASATHVFAALEGRDHLSRFAWGEAQETPLVVDRAAAYERARILIDAEAWTARDVRMLRASPDGSLLAIVSWSDVDPAASVREVLVVDAATGIPVGTSIGWGFERVLLDLAFSPDGRRLAILTGDAERFTDLYVREVESGAIASRWLDTRPAADIAWGARGLAVALREPPLVGSGPVNGTVVLLAEDELRETARWNWTRASPAGLAWAGEDTLVAALGGRLEALDAAPSPEPPLEPAEQAPVPAPAAVAALVAVALAAIALRPRRRRRG